MAGWLDSFVQALRGGARDYALPGVADPMVEKAPRFSGEIATSADDIYGLYWMPGTIRYNPDDLAMKKGGLKIYHEMRRDDQVKAALHLKKSAIVFPGWTIECEDEELEGFARELLEGADGSVEDTLRSILSAYDYGFSLHEKVYKYQEEGDYKGKVMLKALKHKSPTRIHFDLDDYGNLKPDGILQRQRNGEYKRLDPGKFVLHVYQKEFDNFYGESDLRAAYRFWFLKLNFFRWWGMYLEKFGVPTTLGTSDGATLTEAEQAKFRLLVKNIQAGMGAVLPPNLKIELLELGQTDKGAFQGGVEACDVRIARAILLPALSGLTSSGGGGSLARAREEGDVFDMVLGGDSRALETTINEQVLNPLVEINYGKKAKDRPRFKLNPMREEDKKTFAQAFSDAVSKNAASRTIETEKHMRNLLGFPEMTPDEEKKIGERLEAGDQGLELLKGLAPPGREKGNGALGGGDKKEGGDRSDGDGEKGRQKGEARKFYVLTSVNPQEARKRFDEHLGDLDDLEDDAREALGEMFEGNIAALAVDARKKSAPPND